MDQALLVGPDLEIGEEAIALLDAAGITPVVALMAVLPEYGDWRLILSSPQLDQSRLLKAQNQVHSVLHGAIAYHRLPVILILPIKDHFIQDLRKRYGKMKDVAGMRLGCQQIGDRFIDSAYVYRVQ